MKAFTLSAAALFATLAVALPSPANTNSVSARDDNQYYAVANLVAHDDIPHEVSFTPFNVTIGVLYSNPDIVKLTSISLDGAETNVPGETIDVDKVQCQRFKDQWALQPGSALFKGKNGVASISTNPVELGYILCYVLPDE